MRKRVITILFSFVVVLSVLPFVAYAETGNPAASYTESSKTVTQPQKIRLLTLKIPLILPLHLKVCQRLMIRLRLNP